jgi:phosphohistidine phosphatase SixA
MKCKQDVAFSNLLVPMGEAEEIVREINEKYNVDELVFVSHEPCLSGLIGALTADNLDLSINIKNGGVCCLSADDLRLERKAVLEWLLTPKVLSAVS